jgi:NTE family protein
MRALRKAANPAAIADPVAAASLRVPPAEIYAIDVSFPRLKDKAEFSYLNSLPTSFVLPDEAVDRLRASAGAIIQASPEFQRLLKDIRARVIDAPPPAPAAAR